MQQSQFRSFSKSSQANQLRRSLKDAKPSGQLVTAMVGKSLHHSVKASQGPRRRNVASFSDMNKNYAGHSLARHYETAGLKKRDLAE